MSQVPRTRWFHKDRAAMPRALGIPTPITGRISRRTSPIVRPRAAAISASCGRARMPTPRNVPATHQRSRLAAQAAPRIPSTVTGCVHREVT